MWNSESRESEDGTQYKLEDLDFLINYIGSEFDLYLEDKGKENECEIPMYSWWDGITIGEYVVSLHKIFLQMISNKPSKAATLFEEALVSNMIDLAFQLLSDRTFDEDYWQKKAQDAIQLYEVIQGKNRVPVWSDENDKSIPMPAVEKLTTEDWKLIEGAIEEEFTWGDSDWQEFENYKTCPGAPSEPTDEEYERALHWFDLAYSNTNTNKIYSEEKKSKKDPYTQIRHDVFKIVQEHQQSLACSYLRISNRVSEDPGTAGDQVEELWANLLRGWLPASYKVVTKGRIVTSDNWASGQVDLIVLKPSYPPSLVNNKLYIAAGVAAVFECKLNIRRDGLKKAIKTISELQRKFEPIRRTPFCEANSEIITGILAVSVKNLDKSKLLEYAAKIIQAYRENTKGIRELPDILSISDVSTFSTKKKILVGPHCIDDLKETVDEETSGRGGAVVSLHYEDPAGPEIGPNPIFYFLSEFLIKLGRRDSSIREISNYFQNIYSPKTTSINWMEWLHAFSEETIAKLEKNGYSPEKWNEWNKNC